jgi:hypothetical protein
VPFWLAGRPAFGSGQPDGRLDVRRPDGRLVASVSVPTPAQVEEAVTALDASRGAARQLTQGWTHST